MLRAALSLLLLLPSSAYAATVVSAGSGNWNSMSTWTGHVIPASGDTVTIAAGHTVTIPFGYTAIVGTSPVSGGAPALVQNGPLVINGALIMRGPVTGGNAPVIFGPGASFTWDASLASTPQSTNYAWTLSGYARGNRGFMSNGTAQNRVTIQSNPAGGAGYFIESGSDAMWWNASYTTFVRIGDPTHSAIAMVPSSDCTIETFDHDVFDTSGALQWTHSAPVCGGWSLTNNTWKNTNSKPNSTYRNHTPPLLLMGIMSPTGLRLVQHNVFDQPPVLIGRGTSYQDNFFLNGWDFATYGVGATEKWAAFSGNFARTNIVASGGGMFDTLGDLSGNNYFFLDRTSTLYTDGVVAGATNGSTSSTMTVNGTPWVTNAYSSSSFTCASGFCDYFAVILSGPGAGQFNRITSNTRNTLMLLSPWVTLPDASSSFAIYAGVSNPHWIAPEGHVPTVTYAGSIVESGNTDFNGDVYLHMGSETFTINYNLVLPNAARDNTGTLMTLFGGPSGDMGSFSFSNNTFWAGSQSPAFSEGGSNSAHQITSFRNNLIVDDPGVPYFGGTLGPYKMEDESIGTKFVPTTDTVTAGTADYNAGYGLRSGLSGRGYNLVASATPGTHDVDGNPLFVDNTRGFRKWAAHAGSVGNVIAAGDDALAQMQKMNDAGFNPAYTINSLLTWVRAGWSPQASGLHNAGYGGVDIGAVPYTDPNAVAPPTPLSIALTPGPITLLYGATQTLTCTTTLSDATTRACIAPLLTSSNPASATVSGLTVTATSSAGIGSITATAESLLSSADVFTVAAPAPVTVSLTLVPGSLNLLTGASQVMTCIATLSDNTSRACINPILSSSNTASAAVSGILVTATSTPGSGTIIVTAEGLGQSAGFTVTAPAPTAVSIALSPASINLLTGAKQTMTCVTTLSDNSSRSCINPMLSSSNTSSATTAGLTVSATSVAGSGSITATAESLTSSASFTVSAPTAVSIALSPASINLLTGAKQTMTCVTTLSDNSSRSCINPMLSSSNTSSATTAGLVVSATSVAGSGNITAIAESLMASVGFTVTAPAPTPVSISLSPNPITLLTGATQTIACTATMSDNTTRPCINPVLATSNAASATVAGLVVTAATTVGTGTITATAESLTSSADAFTVAMYPNTSVACSAMSVGPNGALNGFVPSPNDAWHQDIANAPIDPNSATIVNGRADLGGTHLRAGFSSIVNGNYGIPYTVVDSQNTASVVVPIVLYPKESDVAAIPLPLTLPVEGNPGECPTDNNDRHAIIVDRNKCVAYELYQAAHCTSGWTASASSLWDLTTTEARPWTYTSADAAGLSVFEGLIRYDEIVAGVINHAIRFTAQLTKSDGNIGYFTPPATHAAGNYPTSDNIMGMRIRLQPDFDISGFSPTNQIILKAMKQYGMILADNGTTLAFQGTPDARWNDTDLTALRAIPSTAFDVIQMGTVYESATVPTGAAPTITSFTPSVSTVAAGDSVTLTPTVTDASYSYVDNAGFARGPIVVAPTVTTTYTLTSRNAFGSTSAATTVTVQAATVAPTLQFNAIPNQTFGAASFAVGATSNSAGAISYSIGSGPATILGNTVTLTGAGTVVVNASQVASGSYGTATAGTSFIVNPGNPTLAFVTIPNQGYGVAAFPISATTKSSGSIVYSLVSGPATLSGNVLTATGLGKITLQANQAAAGNYAAAVATTSFTVTVGGPTLTITSIPDQTFGSPPITLSATSTSPAPIVYSISVGYASISGNTLTLLRIGAMTITAKQAATGNYAAANVSTSFNVLSEPPNLAINSIPDKVFGTSPPFSPSTTSISSATVSYSIVSGPATASGHTVTLTGVGRVVLQASQPASGNYAAATTTTSFAVTGN